MGQNANTKMLSVPFNPESQSPWPNLGRANGQVFTEQYESLDISLKQETRCEAHLDWQMESSAGVLKTYKHRAEKLQKRFFCIHLELSVLLIYCQGWYTHFPVLYKNMKS